MRKFIFAIGFMALSFNSFAQCNQQSTQINTSCGGSYCYSSQMQPTGLLEVDNGLMDISGNIMYRKPNGRELLAMVSQLEALCD